MRKLRWVAVLGLLAFVLPGVQALADNHMETTVHGEVRMRAENVANYYSFDDNEGEDTFSFAPYRVRLGVGTSFGEKVYGYAEVQVGDYFGADYPHQMQPQTNEGFPRTGELVLYQGYVKMNNVGDTPLSLKFGRQEYVQGNELLFGDLDFYNGISFDGVRARWDLEAGPLDVVWFRVSEDDDDPDEDEAADIIGGNFSFDDVLENGDIAVYAYSVHDQEGDLCGYGVKCEFYTIGARAGQSAPEDGGAMWNAELVFQTGDLSFGSGDEDISAHAFEGMFGWDFGNGHALWLGGYLTSGDDNPTDTDHEDFISLYGDFHRRNGAMDVVSGAHNLTSLSLGWQWTGEKDSVKVEYFHFMATEDGAVPAPPVPEGSSGWSYVDIGTDSGLPGYDFMYIPLDGEDDVGSEIDIIYNRTVNENFGFEAGIGVFMPGKAVLNYEGIDDDVHRLWGQARLRF